MVGKQCLCDTMEAELIKKFKELSLKANEIALCRLGQHSFLMKTNGKLIAFDPYLADIPQRLIKPLLKAEDLADFDLIFGSHDHSDHIDRPQLAAMAQGRAKFVFPEAVVPSITEIPHERIIAMKGDDEIEFDGMKIYALPSAHEFLDKDANGAYFNLGFVLKNADVSIYHSGDCCIYEGLLSRLKKLTPDIMLLPINGRDAERYKRNCIGNMTYQEAVDLAGLSGCRVAIPAHYDMFEGNLENPQLFIDYANVKFPELKTGILAPGEIIVLSEKK